MKKALIITYYWPPSGGAGVQRWLKFVKYLRRYGWEPVIYTPENPEFPEYDPSLLSDIPAGIEILKYPIREPYNAYKKLLGRKKEERINAAFLSERKKNRLLEYISVWIRGNLFIPDARKFWIRPSVSYLSEYLQQHHADVLISTGPPHSMHLIAMYTARKSGLPWLADFRDPWTSIDFYKDLHLTRRADRKHRSLEYTVLQNAGKVVAISENMARDFNRILPGTYEVITNGFDPADIPEAPVTDLDRKFSIAHIGTLTGSRNPLTLWIALKELLKENENLRNDLEIQLIGKVDHSVTDSISVHDLQPFVTRIDYLPHREVIRYQQKARLLLLVINDTPNAAMILTGKFFEYLASGRPVLCLGPAGGDAAGILKETQSGLIAGFGEVEKMKNNLLFYYSLYRSGQSAPPAINIQKYSREYLTGRLAGLLDQLTGQ